MTPTDHCEDALTRTSTEEQWDAIVVGGGLGGLTCAAYLAVAGRRVLVLEQHDWAGGNSHVFRRRRAYEFDVGVHYLGDCGSDGVIPAVLAGLGAGDRVPFRELDPDCFDQIVIPGLTLDVPADWDEYLARLESVLPDDVEGLRTFTAICRAVGSEQRWAMLTDAELPEIVSRHRSCTGLEPSTPVRAVRPLRAVHEGPDGARRSVAELRHGTGHRDGDHACDGDRPLSPRRLRPGRRRADAGRDADRGPGGARR